MKKRLITVSVCFLLVSAVLIGLTGTVAAVAPDTPGMPEGPTEADLNELCEFSVGTVNASDSHDVLYEFDWGDNLTTGWIGPFPSGEGGIVEASHKWKENGEYQIKVRAKDNTTAEESDWSEPLNVTIGRPGPRFSIGAITGGFGVTAAIINNCAPSKYVDYKIEIAGGQITGFHTNQRFEGTIFIKSGTSEIVSIEPFFAIGRVKITVTAECAGEEVAEKVVYGFVLFYYVIMLS